MKLRDLHVFITVVKRGSMVKAADELAMSQPAVSKAIGDLERTLGVRLLDRSHVGARPTAFGEAIVRRGLTIFDEIKLGTEELAQLADPTTGYLRIGCTESIAAGALPVIVERFSQEYPRVQLDIAQVVIRPLNFVEVRERAIDLFIGRVQTPFAEEDLTATVIYPDPVVVVTSQRSKWARMRRLRLAELVKEPWILPPAGTMAWSLAEELFQAGGAELPTAQITTLSINLTCRLVASGRYVATLPQSILHFGRRNVGLKALPISLLAQPRPVAIVRLKNRTLSAAAERFIACAQAVMKGRA